MLCLDDLGIFIYLCPDQRIMTQYIKSYHYRYPLQRRQRSGHSTYDHIEHREYPAVYFRCDRVVTRKSAEARVIRGIITAHDVYEQMVERCVPVTAHNTKNYSEKVH